ncbi:MAG: VWA domain-containing protein [Candidatus Rokubacteria bacterium]|nr:VWA domain-containing protein [Candidatus Rokubacteria bacterium]
MTSTPPLPRDLVTATLSFCRLLRRHGLPVTVGEATDAVRALERLDLADRAEVYLGLRSVLMSRIEEQPAFDRCFEAFWKEHREAVPVMDGLLATAPAEPPASASGTLRVAGQKREGVALEAWIGEDEASESEPLGVPGMSDREYLMEQDFSGFPADQLDELARLTVLIARRLARRISRRRRPTRRRGVVDLRRTIRANLTRGELIELRRKERKRRKVRLVLLCDISGSMDLYSRFLLQFLYALQNVFGRVETFTFSTRLTRITDYLKGASYRQVLRRLGDVRDWSGGTRIGECLADFNREWRSRFLDRHTIVVVLSDGWDTGDPELLAGELLKIKRRAGQLLWLNPLLGNPAYQPLTRGMAAALPILDRFAPAHNLQSLRDLASQLRL